MNTKWCFPVIMSVFIIAGCEGEKVRLVAPESKVENLAGGFVFTEGPAADAKGNVYFTDIPNNRIHKWSTDGKLSVFRENSQKANGLYFDKAGNMFVCQGGARRMVVIDIDGELKILTDNYESKAYNTPNDLWIDPKGGVYFTDPRYGDRSGMVMAEHVYYLADGSDKPIRVIDDMTRPNGLIGTADGSKLYVTDPGAGETFSYTISPNGTLSDKKLFVSEGSDGMTIDNKGNIYLTTSAVAVFNPAGEKVETIEVPERPSNVCFGGKGKKTLFITARTSLYSVDMNVRGF